MSTTTGWIAPKLPPPRYTITVHETPEGWRARIICVEYERVMSPEPTAEEALRLAAEAIGRMESGS